MFGLRPVCGASFMQGCGRSGRCERVVPALSGEAGLGLGCRASSKRLVENVSPSAAGIAADDWQHLAGDVARAGRRRQEHEGGRDFFRLRRPLHRRIGTEFGDFLGRFVGRISGVHTGPGATAFTRMPRSTRWVASDRVKA